MTIGFAVAGLSGAQAADLDVRGPRLVHVGHCAWNASGLASLPIDAMREEVNARYVSSVEESESNRTVFSRSPRIIWAFESRQACGIALGYLSTGEINADRLRNCECFYARMVSYRAGR